MQVENVNALDAAGLRSLAKKMGVQFDKKVDDESSLRKKLKKALAKSVEALGKEKAGTFDVSKRAPWEKGSDKPLTCFGWFYEAKSPTCHGCVHAEFCKPISASATKAIAEAEAEEELEGTTADEAKALVKTEKTKKTTKASKGDSISEESPKAGAISEKTKLKLAYDLEWAAGNDDIDLRKFYKRLLRKAVSDVLTVGECLDTLVEVFDVDDSRESMIEDLLIPLIAQGDFVRV